MWKLALLYVIERNSILLKLMLTKLETAKFRLNMLRHLSNGCTVLLTSLTASGSIPFADDLSPVFAVFTYLLQQYIGAKKYNDRIAEIRSQIIQYDGLREKVYISKNNEEDIKAIREKLPSSNPIFDTETLDLFYKTCKEKGIEVQGEGFESLQIITELQKGALQPNPEKEKGDLQPNPEKEKREPISPVEKSFNRLKDLKFHTL